MRAGDGLIATAKTDTRIVYGARCTWWDGIDKIALTPPGASGHRIPCCPHCGSMLFEMDSEQPWWNGVDRYEQSHPGYRAMITWARGKCFPDMTAMTLAYEARSKS